MKIKFKSVQFRINLLFDKFFDSKFLCLAIRLHFLALELKFSLKCTHYVGMISDFNLYFFIFFFP